MDSTLQPSLSRPKIPKVLQLLDLSKRHIFTRPTKCIHEGHDVPHFLSSKAYTDIGVFITQLNVAMCPRRVNQTSVQTFPLESHAVSISRSVQRIREMLDIISAILDEAPPDTGPRRFGNVAFRKWYALLEERADGLLEEYLSAEVLNAGGAFLQIGKIEGGKEGEAGEVVTAKEELKAYLMGSFGSAQRLDYGTGHELSFLAFLGGIWKLGGFTSREVEEKGAVERSIVLGIIEPYLRVIRKLILTYTLEPAGSHGVWGLDDHAFLPYVFGSAQYCPAIVEGDSMPIEGSLPNSPSPGDVAKKNVVDRERKTNMYFAAVGFINDVKTGPFWEHSPILFDISGIKAGWGKINKGMIKMYNAEVLSKFPVVQHFPFGSLFSWEIDPSAPPPPSSTHIASQPSSHTVSVTGDTGGAPQSRPLAQEGTKAPWAMAGQSSSAAPVTTAAPWANARPLPPQSTGMPPTQAPWKSSSSSANSGLGLPTRIPPSQPQGMPPTTAPWASVAGLGDDGPTRAPWAKPSSDTGGSARR